MIHIVLLVGFADTKDASDSPLLSRCGIYRKDVTPTTYLIELILFDISLIILSFRSRIVKD